MKTILFIAVLAVMILIANLASAQTTPVKSTVPSITATVARPAAKMRVASPNQVQKLATVSANRNTVSAMPDKLPPRAVTTNAAVVAKPAIPQPMRSQPQDVAK